MCTSIPKSPGPKLCRTNEKSLCVSREFPMGGSERIDKYKLSELYTLRSIYKTRIIKLQKHICAVRQVNQIKRNYNTVNK